MLKKIIFTFPGSISYLEPILYVWYIFLIFLLVEFNFPSSEDISIRSYQLFFCVCSYTCILFFCVCALIALCLFSFNINFIRGFSCFLVLLIVFFFCSHFAFVEVSATCGIRNIHEVNNKIIKARKFQNLDIHVHGEYNLFQ